MSDRILVGKSQPRVVAYPEDPDTAWRLMGWIGFGLGLVAYADLALALYPVRIGNPQWEFGTFSRVFDSMPLPTMATLLFFAASVARGSKWGLRAVATWSALVGLLLVAALVLYGLTVPVALGVVTDPLAATGLKKAITKALIQGTVYPVLFFGMGIFGWRTARRATPRPA
jgi:hypothetical protein